MKRFSKILAVVLVISLFASIFAVTASAISNDTTKAAYQIAFKDESGNVISSAKSGDVVDMYVSVKTYAYATALQLQFSYPKDALTHTRSNVTTVKSVTAKNGFALLGNFANTDPIEDEDDPIWQYEDENVGNGYYKHWGAGEFIGTPHNTTQYPSTWTDEQKEKYNLINLMYTTDPTDSVLLINTDGEFAEFVRIRFIAQKDVTLDGTDFTAPICFVGYNTDGDVLLANCQKTNATKCFASLEFAKAAAKKVYHVANQVQKNADDASLINIGVKGGFKASDIAIAFNDAGTSTNVKNVGAKVTINDVTQTGTERFVYDVNGDGSEYQFRAVINGVDPSNASEIKVVLYVEMTDGTTHEANEVTISTSDIAALAAKVQ